MSEKISKKDVEHVAKLARVELSTEEQEKFAHELSGVLGYVEKLQEVDTEHVEPTYHPAAPKGHNVLENITREDRVIPSADREKILNQAPERDGDYIKVKSVF